MPHNFDIFVPEFIVRLCRDVFLEALRFGDRRLLTKLERVDRHLHQIIENFFKLRPFLRLSLEVVPRFLILITYIFISLIVFASRQVNFVYSSRGKYLNSKNCSSYAVLSKLKLKLLKTSFETSFKLTKTKN